MLTTAGQTKTYAKDSEDELATTSYLAACRNEAYTKPVRRLPISRLPSDYTLLQAKLALSSPATDCVDAYALPQLAPLTNRRVLRGCNGCRRVNHAGSG